MNVFQLCGDMSLLVSILVLLARLLLAKNAQGISLKTQELLLCVFVTRYLDLFTTFDSLYDFIMKVSYIVSTASIVYVIKFQEPIKTTYNETQDTFLHWKFGVAPCAVIAFLTIWIGSDLAFLWMLHWKFGVAPCAVIAFLAQLTGSDITCFNELELLRELLWEFLWTFSLFLEVMAMLPQALVFIRYGEVGNLTGIYVFLVGAYRFFYILNWIYRANTEPEYKHQRVLYFCGALQALFLADFLHYYFKFKQNGPVVTLPQENQVESTNNGPAVTLPQGNQVQSTNNGPVVTLTQENQVESTNNGPTVTLPQGNQVQSTNNGPVVTLPQENQVESTNNGPTVTLPQENQVESKKKVTFPKKNQ